MVITDNQLKGNWAEQYIAAELASQGCFVRHVTQGHDSGIDLYCESTKNGTPFLHFECQIKTKKRWKGRKEAVSYKPEKQHIEYWLKQPVPVYIFLVPDLRDKSNHRIPYYICRAFDSQNGVNKIYSFAKVDSVQDLKEFLNKHLSVDTLFWELKDGKVSPLKTLTPQRNVEFLPGSVHNYERKVFTTLRWTLWRLSSDIMFEGSKEIKYDMLNKSQLTTDEKERVNSAAPYIEALKILIESKDDKHYEGYYIIGNYCELKKKYEESVQYYRKSLAIMEADKKINKSENQWRDLIETIKQAIKRVEAKIPKQRLRA